MKKIFTTILLLCAVFAVSLPSEAQETSNQTRKEARLARKEQRRQEKAITDSLMKVLFGVQEVNVGYGKTDKNNLTTAVSSVSPTNKEVSSYGDIGEYLMGRVPGLQVTKRGNSYSLQIRGATTIGNASTEPLVLVDGVETNDIGGLNPHDIKSVEVLKDAAASSIYGSRAACGAVLITTKGR